MTSKGQSLEAKACWQRACLESDLRLCHIFKSWLKSVTHIALIIVLPERKNALTLTHCHILYTGPERNITVFTAGQRCIDKEGGASPGWANTNETQTDTHLQSFLHSTFSVYLSILHISQTQYSSWLLQSAWVIVSAWAASEYFRLF